MSEFKRGDKVRITIEPAEVQYAENYGNLEYEYGAELGTCEGVVALDSDAVTVEHLPSTPAPVATKPAPDPGEGIGVLGFSPRIYNLLRRDGIHEVRTLLVHSADDLTDIRNFGPACLAEVRSTLAAHGLELKS